MISLKLAYRNIVGAGLRTWLSVIVLSFSFVLIIWNQGLLNGWDRQARRDTIAWEIGGGQYWHEAYDPFDPFALSDSHALVPEKLKRDVQDGRFAPVLIAQTAAYPEGRMHNLLLKGIEPGQNILELPTKHLDADIEEIPAIIGERTADSLNLNVGELMTVRWRDANGMFDARDVKIMSVMETDVISVDKGQLWIPLKRMREMMQAPGEATLIIVEQGMENPPEADKWVFRDHEYLMRDITQMIKTKTVGQSIFYLLLLSLALLAIFDTQILAIFRRRKEIGTLIALGMTRGEVIRLFTLEGAMHGVLAAIVGAVYGIPLLAYFAIYGLGVPQSTEDFGYAIAERIYPAYSLGLVTGTTLIILVTVTIVSFIPTRKIARLKPTDAIRGTFQ